MTTRRDFLRQTALLGAGLTISPFFIKAGSAGVWYIFAQLQVARVPLMAYGCGQPTGHDSLGTCRIRRELEDLSRLAKHARICGGGSRGERSEEALKAARSMIIRATFRLF